MENRIGKGPSSKIHSELHPREVKLTSIHRPHSCLSPPPFPHNQGRLESIENQGNDLKISCLWNVPDQNFTSKGTSETRGSTGTPITRTLKPWSLDVKQQIEVRSQREASGCTERIRGQKHYRWMGQISVLLLTQPDTRTERLSLVQHCCFWLFVRQGGLRVFSLLFWQLYNEQKHSMLREGFCLFVGAMVAFHTIFLN